MAALTVSLVSADQEVWSGEAASIVARTSEGEIGILAPGARALHEHGAGDWSALVGPHLSRS